MSSDLCSYSVLDDASSDRDDGATYERLLAVAAVRFDGSPDLPGAAGVDEAGCMSERAAGQGRVSSMGEAGHMSMPSTAGHLFESIERFVERLERLVDEGVVTTRRRSPGALGSIWNLGSDCLMRRCCDGRWRPRAA